MHINSGELIIVTSPLLHKKLARFFFVSQEKINNSRCPQSPMDQGNASVEAISVRRAMHGYQRAL